VSRALLATAIAATISLAPSSAAGQAFTLPQGVGGVTLAFQHIDNTGHRPGDGSLIPVGQSVSDGLLFELDYGITDRLAVSLGLPYVFAKYTDGPPPPFIPYLPVDTCHCWHSSLQDLSLSARYRLGNGSFALTPQLRYVVPTFNYQFRGEAVVGRDLRELQVGGSAAYRLENLLPRASVQLSYFYSFVERPIDVRNDRSNFNVSIGYALTPRLYLFGAGFWQWTHGGLEFGSPSGIPFFPPGTVNTPERLFQHDRMLKDNFFHAGGGVSYSLGQFDVFASYAKYVSGINTHNGAAYTVGTTWYFDRLK